MSAVSSRVTPRSRARLIVAIDSSQSAAPYHSLIPMQPRPCAETVRSRMATVRISVLPFGRAYIAAVDTDLVVEQLQALLTISDGLLDDFAVSLQQFETLPLAGSRPDEFGVALHVTHGHPGGAQ